MASTLNLDDTNQTVCYIPFSCPDDEIEHTLPLPSNRSEYDLPDGHKLQLNAYKEAWKKTLDRMQSLIKALHTPVVEQVMEKVHNSYLNELSGLPYPELPVICVTNPASSSRFINEIVVRLESAEFNNEDLSDIPYISTSLYPTDCGNITSTMRAVIGGFVDRPEVLTKVKRRPTTSLANYDIEMVLAWYKSVRETYDITTLAQPKLVVILHDFEEFDPKVVQDLFYICSLRIPQLPLVFILSLSSPPSPSYLQIAYPRSTLALLRTHKYNVPSGINVLEEVVFKTFFDPEFEPDVMIGPTLLRYIVDNFTRQNSSLEALISILHLAHLKHFSAEPLTCLVQSTPSPDALSHPTSFHFLDNLLTHLQNTNQDIEAEGSPNWPKTVSALLATIDDARVAFCSRARKLRIGSGLLRLVQNFMKSQGYKGLDWDQRPGGILDIMVDVLRGKLGSGVKLLGTMVRKLRMRQLSTLLEEIHIFFQSLPAIVRSDEEEARAKIVVSRSALPEQMDDDVSAISSQLAESIGEWLVEYLNDLLCPLEGMVLWEVWYTGLSPFPSDLMNPSVRASMLAGLLRPYDFVDSDDAKKRVASSLSELPDISILFRRYLDSGKMINVYDWFESFQLELETQRKNLRKKLALEATKASLRKGKGKGKGPALEDPGPGEDDDDDDDEKWRIEIQARFMRALQELDYLGFIKHTGRKADHVQRVVYDIHD